MSCTIRVHLSDALAHEDGFVSEIRGGKSGGAPTLYTWFKHHLIENGGPGLYIPLNYFSDPIPELLRGFIVKYTLRESPFPDDDKRTGHYRWGTASGDKCYVGTRLVLHLAATYINDLETLYRAICTATIKPAEPTTPSDTPKPGPVESVSYVTPDETVSASTGVVPNSPSVPGHKKVIYPYE
ncbi:MAG: hypothetical protein V1895_02085 [Parcubacteria group bacterium]